MSLRVLGSEKKLGGRDSPRAVGLFEAWTERPAESEEGDELPS